MQKEYLKLNLGCGVNHLPGHINVDKFGNPDLRHDLECFPWPWPDNSTRTVVLNHVLEHLGANPDVFFGIIRELYRICAPDARIEVAVPHPRHDHFINDPTHVRIVTPEMMLLFSMEKNFEWKRKGHANSPLAFYLNVDFELVKTVCILDEIWAQKLERKEINEDDVAKAAGLHNNVVKEFRMTLRVVKPPRTEDFFPA